jgi:polysaccharide biosynthesis transport protein
LLINLEKPDMKTQHYTEEIDLKNYWLVLKRRWLVAAGIFLTSVAVSGFVISLQKSTYEAAGKLLFQANRTSSLTGVGEKIGSLESFRNEANPLSTQAAILQSRPIAQEVIEALDLKDNKGRPLLADAFKIKVEAVPGTDILNVSFTWDNPEIASSVVNKLMDVYVANNLANSRSEAVSAGKFIELQIPQAKIELDKAAEGLRSFKTLNQIISLKEESESTVKIIEELSNKLNEARGQLADVASQQAEVRLSANIPRDRTVAQTVNVSSLSVNPGVQGTLTELQKVQNNLAVARARYTEGNPIVIDLREQEATLNQLLQQRVADSSGSSEPVAPGKLQIGDIKQDLANQYVSLQSQRAGLEEKVQTLASLHEAYKRRANIFPNLEKKQGELERNLTIAQKTYEELLTRQQAIRLAENQAMGNARVIQNAIAPSSPISSKLTLLLAVGGVFVGVFLGVAAAFLVDSIDKSIKTIKEAQTLFGYTALGLIPKFDANSTSLIEEMSGDGVSPRIIVATSPRTVIHEAYQMLRANLKFISHKQVRTIVVTSSVAGEGKSEVSANLAAAIAQTGKRVLLVDADMRQPSQHHLWGLMNVKGLSNLLVDRVKLNKVVQKVSSNLSLLTAGVIPPNPVALIDSESMNNLIQTMASEYEYIIFDTPPLAGTADAAVLGKMADGVLMVVRPGIANSDSAIAAKSLLARSEANILGLVANGVSVKHEPGSYFYYDYARTEMSSERAKAVSMS